MYIISIYVKSIKTGEDEFSIIGRDFYLLVSEIIQLRLSRRKKKLLLI